MSGECKHKENFKEIINEFMTTCMDVVQAKHPEAHPVCMSAHEIRIGTHSAPDDVIQALFDLESVETVTYLTTLWGTPDFCGSKMEQSQDNYVLYIRIDGALIDAEGWGR